MRDIIIDTDPGVDDLFAILMALGSSELNVLAITSICGNVGIEHTTRNALRILALAGRSDVPVYSGASQPLCCPLVHAREVHGEDGLQGVSLPAPLREAEPQQAADFLVEAIMSRPPGTIDLACLGPLTNIALALRREPEIATRLHTLTAMGGAFGTYSTETPKGLKRSSGNITPYAKFNVYCDPEAAAIVVDSPVPLTMIPLDTTHRAIVTPEILERICAVPRIGPTLGAVLDGYNRFNIERWGMPCGPLHDANVIAWLGMPEAYGILGGRIQVATDNSPQPGQTTFEEQPVGRHTITTIVDADVVFEALLASLASVAG